ncbi:MAG: O-antigen ligase family protein [Gammaproteobacteria bacterium]
MRISASSLYQRVKPLVPRVLLLTYCLFTIGYFLFPSYHVHYRYYAKAVAIPGLLVFWEGLREIRHHPVFKLAILYLVYLLTTAAWSTPFELYRFGQMLTISFYLLIFIAVTHVLRMRIPTGFHYMLRICIGVAAVASVASLIVFYQTHSFPTARAEGSGSLTNVNEYSNVFGVFALLAMGYALKAESRYARALYILAVLCFISFMWFGQSRAAFASLFAALFLLAFIGEKHNKTRVAILTACALVLLIAMYPDLLEMAWTRGAGLRPLIWQAMFVDIRQAPIFGQGLITPMSYIVEGDDFGIGHNAFLQALWQGGVVGMGLLLLLTGSALWYAYRLGKETGNFTILALLVFCVLVMQTGVNSLISRPRDQWMVFWFPLALLISYQTPLGKRSHSAPCSEPDSGSNSGARPEFRIAADINGKRNTM